MKENVFVSQPRNAAKIRIRELQEALTYVENLIDVYDDHQVIPHGWITQIQDLSNEIAVFLASSNGASIQLKNEDKGNNNE